MSLFFSVIVPTTNRPTLLQNLLSSLAQQKLKTDEFEVIIIPSPNDTSISLIKKLQNIYPWLRLELPTDDPYQGRSASFKRNHGAKMAKAAWLAFTDDDCEVDAHWLICAKEYIEKNPSVAGLEGHVEIKQVSARETLTLKGMRRLQRAGGYQTCNMFYRRAEFINLKGFDLAFPYYLEDTDMAWSMLEAGHQIDYLAAAIITHPELPADPWKLVTMASKSGQHLRLRAKHPKLYHDAKMKPIRASQWFYALVTALLFLSVFISLQFFMMILLFFILVVTLHMFKMYRGLSFGFKEFLQVALLTPLVPWVAIYHVILIKLGPKDFWHNPKTLSSL